MRPATEKAICPLLCIFKSSRTTSSCPVLFCYAHVELETSGNHLLPQHVFGIEDVVMELLGGKRRLLICVEKWSGRLAVESKLQNLS